MKSMYCRTCARNQQEPKQCYIVDLLTFITNLNCESSFVFVPPGNIFWYDCSSERTKSVLIRQITQTFDSIILLTIKQTYCHCMSRVNMLYVLFACFVRHSSVCTSLYCFIYSGLIFQMALKTSSYLKWDECSGLFCSVLILVDYISQ